MPKVFKYSDMPRFPPYCLLVLHMLSSLFRFQNTCFFFPKSNQYTALKKEPRYDNSQAFFFSRMLNNLQALIVLLNLV